VERASESDDLYNLDESDDDDDKEEDEDGGDEARPTPSAMTSPHFDGYIPEFWGVRYTEGPDRPERNNSFRFMLSSHAYYSEQSNSVFTGQSASDASLYERDYAGAYRPSLNNQVYARAPRGVPRDPFEVNQLLTTLNDRSRFTTRERIEAFLLLTELYDVSRRVLPALRDRAMECIIKPGAFEPNRGQYFNEASTTLPHPTIRRAQPLDAQGRHNTQPPPLKEVFDLDAHGLHVLLHARPGSISSVLGILIDYAFRVNR